jgi:hypothetical protein
MPFPAWPSLSYGTTDNQVYDFQTMDKDRLWEGHKDRVTTWLDSIEKCNTGARAKLTPKPKTKVGK